VTRILVLYGTRPEAIKLAPVVRALRDCQGRCAVTVCTTAQHRELTDQAERVLGLKADIDLDLMEPEQPLNRLASRVFAGLDAVLASSAPDWLIVQGDTTSAMASALAAFHRGVRVAHVEGGLRTGDLARPFPEEVNRRVVDLVASAHFAPTARARASLLAEGVPAERIFLTGNTVVDAVQAIAAQLPPRTGPRNAEVLVTVHRRESFGAPIRGLFGAIADLARLYPAIRWRCPVHPNPEVAAPAREILAGIGNVDLLPPLDYIDLVDHLRRSLLVLTDSGGLQEEAPAFGTPVLVLRETTERPEGVWAGVARLVGVDRARVVAETRRALDSPQPAWGPSAENPYGDGRAADRIAAILTGQPWIPFTPSVTAPGQLATARR
jgi:UDP-N-acetylglucosamine 2-epimerase (non-hydrolysing)